METTEAKYDDEYRTKPRLAAEALLRAQIRDLWLDDALQETFPASDPVASGLCD